MILQYDDQQLWHVLERCYLKNAVQELGMFLVIRKVKVAILWTLLVSSFIVGVDDLFTGYRW